MKLGSTLKLVLLYMLDFLKSLAFVNAQTILEEYKTWLIVYLWHVSFCCCHLPPSHLLHHFHNFLSHIHESPTSFVKCIYFVSAHIKTISTWLKPSALNGLNILHEAVFKPAGLCSTWEGEIMNFSSTTCFLSSM